MKESIYLCGRGILTEAWECLSRP